MPTENIYLQQESAELISEEVREIISYRPHWMIRRGNVVFLLVLLLLLSFTFFISYPDIVVGSARLVAVDAPQPSVAKREGKLVFIAVNEGQAVKKGDQLAYLESTADHREVLRMYAWIRAVLNEAAGGQLIDRMPSFLPLSANLGELQPAYQSFVREWGEQQQLYGSGYYQQKKASLQQDLQFTARLKTNLEKQESLGRQVQALQQEEFAAYDSLAKDKLVAPLEVHAYKNKLINLEQGFAQSDAQLIQNEFAAHTKRKELLELEKQVLDQQQKLLTALLLLKSETEKWLQQYVLTAPREGTLFFYTPLQVNEEVGAGQELFYVQPRTNRYYAQAMAGQNNLGKVSEGQPVRLKVESFPAEENGFLQGRVASISGIPNRRDSFLVRLELPNGLVTNYQKEIFFRNQLSATAEIITDDRRLIERFFDPLRKVWAAVGGEQSAISNRQGAVGKAQGATGNEP